jgi:ABC-type nitrate/sulfonate/bicarbonate transport system substrate-binding protein
MIRNHSRIAIVFCFLSLASGPARMAEATSYVAYISDSPAASSVYWVTKDAGFLKKYGLDLDLIFIDGSTRGIQSLISGGVPFTSAVGTSVINGKLAGGDIAIVNSMVNTLPYFVFGKAEIKSPEDLRGDPPQCIFRGPRRTSLCG